MFNAIEEKRRFEADLIDRAQRDFEFREALRSNPKQALMDAYGRAIPWDVQIHNDTQRTMNIVLPVFEDEMSEELDDEMLEHIGGGCRVWSCIFLTF